MYGQTLHRKIMLNRALLSFITAVQTGFAGGARRSCNYFFLFLFSMQFFFFFFFYGIDLE